MLTLLELKSDAPGPRRIPGLNGGLPYGSPGRRARQGVQCCGIAAWDHAGG